VEAQAPVAASAGVLSMYSSMRCGLLRGTRL
jgi:hypothetical protein